MKKTFMFLTSLPFRKAHVDDVLLNVLDLPLKLGKYRSQFTTGYRYLAVAGQQPGHTADTTGYFTQPVFKI